MTQQHTTIHPDPATSTLLLLALDVQAKTQLYDLADAMRDAWPTLSPASFAASEAASRALDDLHESKALLRRHCAAVGLSKGVLSIIADAVS